MGTSFRDDSTTAARHHRRTSQLAASFLPSSSTAATSSGGHPFPTFPDTDDEDPEGAEDRNLAGGGDNNEGDEDDDRISNGRSSLGDASEVVEMDYINEVEDQFPSDEESGLTPHQRKKLLHMRRRQRRQLDSRIVDLKISVSGRRLADRKVLKKLSINTVFILLWYIFSLSISVYNKWMFSPDHLNFPFPLFTTSLHMVVQFVLASAILFFIPSLRPRHPSAQFQNPSARPKSVISKTFYLTRLVPCGCATSLDIGLGNMSLRFITLSFLTMCKSSALGFVLLFAFLFRLETPSLRLILIICTMIVGVVMMVAGEPDFSALGFALVIASAFFSGFRWGLTQILLLRHPGTSNPFSTLFLLTPIMFVSLTIISLLIEGPGNIIAGLQDLAAQNGSLRGVLLLIFPGSLAFCMIAAEFTLLRRSSVVTLSICGIFKEVITIIAGGSVFDDKLTPINITGLVVTIASIAYYNYMKITKMRKDARKDIAVATTDLGNNSDVEDEFQPPPHRQRPGLLDRLGVTFGVSSSSSTKDAGRYQPVFSPIHSPVDPQFSGSAATPTTIEASRGRRSFRARVSPPGPSSLSGSHSSSGNASDTEGSGRLSRKDKAPRSAGQGVLAPDSSDVYKADSGVRERSSSRQRSSP